MVSSQVTATFAMPMSELIFTGVGRNNRLLAEDFEIMFRGIFIPHPIQGKKT